MDKAASSKPCMFRQVLKSLEDILWKKAGYSSRRVYIGNPHEICFLGV